MVIVLGERRIRMIRDGCRSRHSGSRRSASGRRTAARGSGRSRVRSRARRNFGRCNRSGGPETHRSRRRSGWSIAGTAKIGFRAACASAGPLWAATPASASAPVARMVLRSTVSMRCSPCWTHFLSDACLAPRFGPGKTRQPITPRGTKRPAGWRGPFGSDAPIDLPLDV